MMRAALSPTEISTACRLLFGVSVAVTPEFIAGLRAADLRATFRRRALELHPDRAGVLGRDASLLDELFKEVKQAYETLTDLVETGVPSGARRVSDREWPCRDDPEDEDLFRNRDPHARVVEEDGSGEFYWEAGIPERRLLFGQFLYYAGLISWRALIDAIVWQRTQRPVFGRIATMWKYIDQQTVGVILADKRPGERFGDVATRLGYLTPFQKNTVIGLQRWLQRPIGGYFLEIGLLEDDEIIYLVRLMKKHNTRISRQAK